MFVSIKNIYILNHLFYLAHGNVLVWSYFFVKGKLNWHDENLKEYLAFLTPCFNQINTQLLSSLACLVLFRVTATWLSVIFVYLSDAFAKLLESGDLKGSSVRLEGVDMPFHHLLARICFHHHFSGKTHTRPAIKCSQWLRLSENSILERLRFVTCGQWRVYHGFITAIRVLESQYFMFPGRQVEACVGNSVSFTHVVNNCV